MFEIYVYFLASEDDKWVFLISKYHGQSLSSAFEMLIVEIQKLTLFLLLGLILFLVFGVFAIIIIYVILEGFNAISSCQIVKDDDNLFDRINMIACIMCQCCWWKL